jgi:hypothetical protein
VVVSAALVYQNRVKASGILESDSRCLDGSGYAYVVVPAALVYYRHAGSGDIL